MILESVRYYVRCASFCIFRSPEIVSVFKGVRHFCFRLTDKFSRPPRCDHFDIPAYHNARCRIMISRESLCGSKKFIFQNPLRIPHATVSSSLVNGKCGYLRQSRNISITMQICTIIQLLNYIQKFFEYSTLFLHIIKT